MDEGIKGQLLRSLPFLVIELDDGIVLKRGTTEVLVEGDAALETVLLILTATSTTAQPLQQILAQFPATDRPQIGSLLDEMIAKRLLVPSDDKRIGYDAENNEDVFYWTSNTDRSTVANKLSELKIILVGVNRLTHLICQSLNEMGVVNTSVVDDPALRNLDYFDEGGQFLERKFVACRAIRSADHFATGQWDCRLMIATSDFGASGFHLPWNELCVHRGVHFMPVVLKDMIGFAGPLVIPGDTACLQCVRMRQNAHLQEAWLHREIEHHMDRGQSIASIHPSMLTILAETTVFELCHYYGNLTERRPGRLIVINLPGGVTEYKHVLKVPRCPVCSSLIPKSAVQIRKLTPLAD